MEMECCRGGLLPRGSTTALPDAAGGEAEEEEEDRLSALPDDILLPILAALRCARAAAHTSVLARRTELPCFDRTASIKIDVHFAGFTLPPAGVFPALETLHLENCFVDLGDMIPRCPRLRKLSIPFWNATAVTVRSPSLEEMEVYANFKITIDIVAPALKRLYLDARRGINTDAGGFTLSAPSVEDLTWNCECQAVSDSFGVRWRMWSLSFSSSCLDPHGIMQMQQMDNNGEAETAHSLSLSSSSQRRPRGGVLSLNLETNVMTGDSTRSFEQEIFRFQVTDNFSVLELDLKAQGHVYGAIVLHLLGICTSTQRLRVLLDEFLSQDSCFVSCRCDQPNNWRNQSISLTDLKEVEIRGFRGQNHEVDLLKVLLRCATVLERVTVRFSRKVTPSDCRCRELSGILEAYPSVKCSVYYLQSGKQVFICRQQ
ncbi:hypothetical protein OsJ_36405 [Oryza sativa Japonica Group]|uniref:Uncharacterized protein n=1 Tax=Oryza sativa subsp. japonica TaxID=39947 RepID=B9GDL0_ORYSJ|nr:hypothetical protein OsJ_36405 [Oryza sativa Japonica Group]